MMEKTEEKRYRRGDLEKILEVGWELIEAWLEDRLFRETQTMCRLCEDRACRIWVIDADSVKFLVTKGIPRWIKEQQNKWPANRVAGADTFMTEFKKNGAEHYLQRAEQFFDKKAKCEKKPRVEQRGTGFKPGFYGNDTVILEAQKEKLAKQNEKQADDGYKPAPLKYLW